MFTEPVIRAIDPSTATLPLPSRYIRGDSEVPP